MKTLFGAMTLAGLLIVAAQARGDQDRPSNSSPPARGEAVVAWDSLVSSFRTQGGPPLRIPLQEAPKDEVDVVDAHWMALTMWGEARGEGEAAMRAVGHVIANRWRAGGRHGDHVTETVSEAWQFSCWNTGDPNLAAIRNIETLPAGSREYRMWRAARSIAEEILAGRSEDPTGGALFYHSDQVAPNWSRGMTPVARIGSHLFFRAAR